MKQNPQTNEQVNLSDKGYWIKSVPFPLWVTSGSYLPSLIEAGAEAIADISHKASWA